MAASISDLADIKRKSGIIGSAPTFLAALEDLRRYAAADVPLVITGETGTGKELAARAAHYASARSIAPFVPVNCGALPERLLENELFGHRKGAFTDAREARGGLIAQAEGGTLLLDEVDSLDPHAQVALLRFLQDQRYRPLGCDEERQADVRIVAATNAPLERLVAEGRFRRDLLFRLDVARVELPPLRERSEDILPLANFCADRAAARLRLPRPRFDEAVKRRLLDHDWPGNIRELENVMQRAVLLAEDGCIRRCPGIERTPRPEPTAAAEPLRGSLREARERCNFAFERAYLTMLLARTGGNITAASRMACTERRHLGRMIQRHGIDPSGFRLAIRAASDQPSPF
uniref:sigma 54-interacting transcriptional regulator n=1 Tax=uncultured Sphingomonas sp. TaxID=158754 RepID=UPI0035C9E271